MDEPSFKQGSDSLNLTPVNVFVVLAALCCISLNKL